jgi:hypothetical protein
LFLFVSFHHSIEKSEMRERSSRTISQSATRFEMWMCVHCHGEPLRNSGKISHLRDCPPHFFHPGTGLLTRTTRKERDRMEQTYRGERRTGATTSSVFVETYQSECLPPRKHFLSLFCTFFSCSRPSNTSKPFYLVAFILSLHLFLP